MLGVVKDNLLKTGCGIVVMKWTRVKLAAAPAA